MKTPVQADEDARLLSTIREDVIPRLILVHLTRSSDEAGTGSSISTRIPPRDEEVAELARIAALGDLGGALTFIERLLTEGLSMETVLLNLVRPAAHTLDQEWGESNGLTFGQAMVGLDTLEQVVGVLVELSTSE